MRHILALSGGKDSTALAVALKEREPETPFEYAITPTGNELPEMIEHWKKLAALLETRLTVVSCGKSLPGLIQIQRALPNNRQRWCTRQLKIEPYEQFLYTASPCVSYVGLRADEEEREGGIYGHIEGVEQCFPFREWGYDQKLEEWWNLWKDHPEKFAQGEALESVVSGIHGSPCSFRSPGRDSWPAPLMELRRKFEGGSRPRNAGQLLLYGREGRCRVCTL
jgi:hypothetical protein